MFPNEFYCDMFSCLNMTIEEIKSLGLTQNLEGEVDHEILMTFDKPNYKIDTSILHEKNINDIDILEVVGKIRAQEMSLYGEIE